MQKRAALQRIATNALLLVMLLVAYGLLKWWLGTRTPPTSAATVQALAAHDDALAQQLSGERLLPWRPDEATKGATLPPSRGPEAPLHVTLPASGDGAIDVTAHGRTLALKPLGASATSALHLDGALASYPAQFPSTDGVLAAGDDFLAVLWLLRDGTAPTRFEWQLSAPWLATITDDGGDASLLDDTGATVMHLAPPAAVDAEGRAVHFRLEGEGSRLVLTLSDAPPTWPVLAAFVLALPG